MRGETVVVFITERDQRVLTEPRPVLTEERLELFDVGGGGGDDVVTATATTHRYTDFVYQLAVFDHM